MSAGTVGAGGAGAAAAATARAIKASGVIMRLAREAQDLSPLLRPCQRQLLHQSLQAESARLLAVDDRLDKIWSEPREGAVTSCYPAMNPNFGPLQEFLSRSLDSVGARPINLGSLVSRKAHAGLPSGDRRSERSSREPGRHSSAAGRRRGYWIRHVPAKKGRGGSSRVSGGCVAEEQVRF